MNRPILSVSSFFNVLIEQQKSIYSFNLYYNSCKNCDSSTKFLPSECFFCHTYHKYMIIVLTNFQCVCTI